MNEDVSRAVAEFLRNGGQIQKIRETVPVTEQEIIAFLETCGISAKYAQGDVKAFLCNNRRISEKALVELANTKRLARQLPPFAIRLEPRLRWSR